MLSNEKNVGNMEGSIVSIRESIITVSFRDHHKPKINNVLYIKGKEDLKVLVVKSDTRNTFYCVCLTDFKNYLCF